MQKRISFLMVFTIMLTFAYPLFGCAGEYSYVDINHIINPSSGMPYSVVFDSISGTYKNTEDHIISATVLSGSSLEGDSYSTAICVMGLSRATEFIESKISEGKIDSAILFTADGKMLLFGEVFIYEHEDKLNKYKDYELSYGMPMDGEISIEESEYKKGSYSRYTEFAFSEGIEYELHIFGEEKSQKDALKNEIISLIEELDLQINAVKEGTDVSRLNNAPAGTRLEIGQHTYKLLTESKRLYEETDGAFNVAISPLSELWNVDIAGINNYKAIGSRSNWTWPDKLPTVEEIEEAKTLVSLDELELFEEDGAFFASKNIDGLKIDLGGIAKGYAVDISARLLREHGIVSAQLNMSGNVYELGHYFDRELKLVAPWNIGITNPKNKHDILKDFVCGISVSGNVSITTSGDYERFYSYGYKTES